MDFNPDNSFISLSRKAGPKIAKAIGLAHETDEDVMQLKRHLIAALAGAEEMPGTREAHFLARVRMGGCDLVLNCVATKGSPMSKQPYTLIIRGAMTAARYEELVASNPKFWGSFVFEVDGQHVKPFFNEEKNKAAFKTKLRHMQKAATAAAPAITEG